MNGELVVKCLEGALETFKDRGKTYGDSPRKFGEIMQALYPGGLTIEGADQWERFGLLLQIVSKLSRYTTDPSKGHIDSIHDLGVYSLMLESVDLQISIEESK